MPEQHPTAPTSPKSKGVFHQFNSPQQHKSCIYSAAKTNDLNTIRRLCPPGTNVDIPNAAGYTALCIAAINGRDTIITTLKTAGANVNTPVWHSGETPVYLAASFGHASAIHTLHIAGADMDKKNNRDKTPLHVATENGHLNAVKALLDAGADATTRYLFLWTAMDWAKENTKPEHSAILDLLKTHLAKYPTGINPKICASTPLCISKYAKYTSCDNITELSTLTRLPLKLKGA
jgi:ankyrin repeat protein